MENSDMYYLPNGSPEMKQVLATDHRFSNNNVMRQGIFCCRNFSSPAITQSTNVIGSILAILTLYVRVLCHRVFQLVANLDCR